MAPKNSTSARALLSKDNLHGYQDRTVDCMVEHNRRIIIVPMGGGKTVSSLTSIEELLGFEGEDGAPTHFWVFAPKRVALDVWPTEIVNWAHLQGLTVSVVMGTPAQRLKALKAEADIYVINFENIQWLEATIKTLPEGTGVIIDELSRLRNPKSKRAKALMKLMKNVDWRMGLTGTPKPKDHHDLFMQNLVIHGEKRWGKSYYKWRKLYFYPTDYQQYNWEPKPGYEDLLDEQFAEGCFIIGEEELGKAYVEPKIIPHYVDLPKRIMEMHDKALRSWVLRTEDIQEVLASAAVGSIKARQITAGAIYDEDRTVHRLHDVKVEAMQELIEQANEPVLVSYQFLPDLTVMRDLYGADVPVIGDGTSDRKIASYIEAWNRGTIPVMAIHPASAGHGLNLQYGGRRMIWYGLTWSYEEWDQTIRRLARQGQTKPVFVHPLIARGSIDESMIARVQQREDAQDVFLQLVKRVQQQRSDAA